MPFGHKEIETKLGEKEERLSSLEQNASICKKTNLPTTPLITNLSKVCLLGGINKVFCASQSRKAHICSSQLIFLEYRGKEILKKELTITISNAEGFAKSKDTTTIKS